MFEYAKRHHVTLDLSPEASKYFDGSRALDYSKLTPEQEQDSELMSQLRCIASSLAVKHIQHRCNITLHIARPFSLEWDGMVSLFSNFTFEDRYSRLIGTPERFKRIVATLKEAMYEGGQENDIAWWYEWDNPVVSPFTFRGDVANGLFYRGYLQVLSRLGNRGYCTLCYSSVIGCVFVNV